MTKVGFNYSPKGSLYTLQYSMILTLMFSLLKIQPEQNTYNSTTNLLIVPTHFHSNYPPVLFPAILLGVLAGSGLETYYCKIRVTSDYISSKL